MPCVFYKANLIESRVWNGRAISATLFSLFSLIVNVKDVHENMTENHVLTQIGRVRWLAGFRKTPPLSRREWNLCFVIQWLVKWIKKCKTGVGGNYFLTTST